MERGKPLTLCFSKYPFKFIVPKKVGPSNTDAVWIYTITYGGGILSGDNIAFDVMVGDYCTAVLTTQSSTKVYKSVGSQCSEQILEASIGQDALLVVIPDPVTCFSTAKYSQTQIFKILPESSLIIVDWVTNGLHERGEKMDFSFYKSTNRILLEGFRSIVRIASMTTESVYNFLQHQLASMEPLLGVSPYC